MLVRWAAKSLANREFPYFWPVWGHRPWDAVLLAPALTGRRDGPEVPRRLHRASHPTLGWGSVTL